LHRGYQKGLIKGFHFRGGGAWRFPVGRWRKKESGPFLGRGERKKRSESLEDEKIPSDTVLRGGGGGRSTPDRGEKGGVWLD